MHAMLRYALLCCAMLCFVMLCFAMLCYAMLCYAMLCFANYALLCFGRTLAGGLTARRASTRAHVPSPPLARPGGRASKGGGDMSSSACTSSRQTTGQGSPLSPARPPGWASSCPLSPARPPGWAGELEGCSSRRSSSCHSSSCLRTPARPRLDGRGRARGEGTAVLSGTAVARALALAALFFQPRVLTTPRPETGKMLINYEHLAFLWRMVSKNSPMQALHPFVPALAGKHLVQRLAAKSASSRVPCTGSYVG